MAEEQCPAREGMEECVMPEGHEGEHEFAPMRVKREENVIGVDPSRASSTSGVAGPQGPIIASEGMVVMREADVELLVDLAYGSATIKDLDSEDLALLARVRRAKERA